MFLYIDNSCYGYYENTFILYNESEIIDSKSEYIRNPNDFFYFIRKIYKTIC